MRKWFFLVLLFALRAEAKMDCLDGAYDLGPTAAALEFQCLTDESGAAIAEIHFCHRQTLLNDARCTGEGEPVRCQWREDASQWSCDEGGDYPFHAELKRLASTQISYRFQSSFNSGDLVGNRVDSGDGSGSLRATK